MFEGMWGRERRQPAHYTKNYSCCAAPGMKCAEITTIPENSVVVSAKYRGCPQSACSLTSFVMTIHRDYGFMRPAFQDLLLARQVLHSGGARLGGNVGASDGEGPAPGAGKEDAVFVAAKHSHVIDPA